MFYINHNGTHYVLSAAGVTRLDGPTTSGVLVGVR